MTGSVNGKWAGQMARGDVSGFEAFCLSVEGPLYGYALRMVGNPEEAQDIAQEVLLRVFEQARQGRVQPVNGSERALVFAIAHNLAVDVLRKTQRARPPERDGGWTGPQPAEQALLREQLDLALAELPDAHRSALMLREFGELSYAEIAATLSASLDEVKVWIYRGRKRLSQLLDRDGQYVGEPRHEL